MPIRIAFDVVDARNPMNEKQVIGWRVYLPPLWRSPGSSAIFEDHLLTLEQYKENG